MRALPRALLRTHVDLLTTQFLSEIDNQCSHPIADIEQRVLSMDALSSFLRHLFSPFFMREKGEPLCLPFSFRPAHTSRERATPMEHQSHSVAHRDRESAAGSAY